MSERIGTRDLERVLDGLNRTAEALGMERRFELRDGSAAKGIQYELGEVHPGLSHPTFTQIGRTRRDAYRYLTAMVHALESAKRDRDYRREDAIPDARVAGYVLHAPHGSVGIYDPDARNHRRDQEDLGSRPAGADQ